MGSNWKGKLGAIIVALGGLAMAIVPEYEDTIQKVVQTITLLGGALGIFGIRDAIGKVE